MPTDRLTTLQNRYDRLLEANQTHLYIYSDKAERYIKTIREIRTQIDLRREHNKRVNFNSAESQFLRNSKGMSGVQILTKKDMFNLTSPIL